MMQQSGFGRGVVTGVIATVCAIDAAALLTYHRRSAVISPNGCRSRSQAGTHWAAANLRSAGSAPAPGAVNGAARAIVTLGGQPMTVIGFTVAEGTIVEIDAIADPDRVHRIAPGLSAPTSSRVASPAPEAQGAARVGLAWRS